VTRLGTSSGTRGAGSRHLSGFQIEDSEAGLFFHDPKWRSKITLREFEQVPLAVRVFELLPLRMVTTNVVRPGWLPPRTRSNFPAHSCTFAQARTPLRTVPAPR
jgi:hypothetical protein